MTINANAVVKIKDIPNALIEKKHIHEPTAVYLPFHDQGFNEAIEIQGNVGLTLNRERLESLYRNAPKNYEKYLYDTLGLEGVHLHELSQESSDFKCNIKALTIDEWFADAILADLPGLIEVAE